MVRGVASPHLRIILTLPLCLTPWTWQLKYESKEARRVMKSVAKGTYKTSVQKQKESQDQLAEKRTAWYGSMAKAKGEGDVEGGADGPVMSAQ